MKVLSAAEMKACDRATTEQFGRPSLELMRAAAQAVAAMAREQFPQARRVTVLCGRGNNGGDGMMTARLMADAGLEVTTLLLGDPGWLTGDAATAWHELTNPPHGAVHVVLGGDDVERHREAFDADLLVDALVGTGFSPPLKGPALAVLEAVKRSGRPVLAVDLPSGWPADATEAAVDGPVFPADAVVTFTAPKPAHVFGQLTRRWTQPVVVAPIGSPEEAVVSTLKLEWAATARELTATGRAAEANKGSYGHVLVVGGSFGSAGGKAGAPAMTALAALRTGAGLVTAAVPMPAMGPVATIAPELMTWELRATAEGSIAADNLAPERVAALVAGKTVLAIGPGMGQTAGTAEFVVGLLKATTIPAVIDADALNIVARDVELLSKLSKVRSVVVTPHPGEMARLAGMTVAAVQANRLETARSFAARYGVTVVLKGARTVIAHPDGSAAVNTTGNPGMAKGGSGDVLTGVVAALMAQYPKDVGRAVEAAVDLHGLAGDLAVAAGNEHTLLATDLMGEFSRAFRFRSSGENGYVWLQGALHGAAPSRLRDE